MLYRCLFLFLLVSNLIPLWSEDHTLLRFRVILFLSLFPCFVYLLRFVLCFGCGVGLGECYMYTEMKVYSVVEYIILEMSIMSGIW